MWIAIESGTFCARITACASCRNCSVQTTTAGKPRFTSCEVPWTLHDVHDPQLAMPTIAASASEAIASSSAAGAACDVEMRYILKAATP